jgi:hypothetical protein
MSALKTVRGWRTAVEHAKGRPNLSLEPACPVCP